jgi:hypothetical protein
MKMTKYTENEGPYEALTPGNAALLLIDHQVGLLQLVRDASPEEFRNNVLGLAKTAKLFELPVILTTSMDWGPNGPILPELKELFPEVAVIRRPGVAGVCRNVEIIAGSALCAVACDCRAAQRVFYCLEAFARSETRRTTAKGLKRRSLSRLRERHRNRHPYPLLS